MDIKEVFKRYEHIDCLLSDKDWIGDNLKDQITYDLWQAVKAEVNK